MKAAIENNPATMRRPDDKTILIVDDNHSVTHALSFLLQDAGYAPMVFNDGHAALDFARDNVPAAALVDIHLPDINGLVLSRQFRDFFGPDVPIIVLSGDTSMENLNSLPYAGATYFFSKPINSISLLEQLRGWIR